MSTSLIPERPLLISPTLAATIGLEEAVLLHVVSELLLQHPTVCRQQRRWAELSQTTLQQALPFWEYIDIRRVQRSLQGLGLLLVEPVPGKADCQWLAINQPDAKAAPATPPAPPPSPFQQSTGTASYIPANWRPDQSLYRQCEQRGIPRDFTDREVPGFVLYWRDRQKSQYSWHHTFLSWIVARWEKQRTQQAAKEQETEMQADWQPSQEALDILEHGGVSRAFVEDAIPEFVLYWRERGSSTSAWNTKFIAHVRRQWLRYTHALEHDTTPRPITADWTPSAACFDVLEMANIDADFAATQVKSFVLYWQDRNEIHASWNTKFLQHVKFQWAQRMQPASAVKLLDKLSDRSWAN